MKRVSDKSKGLVVKALVLGLLAAFVVWLGLIIWAPAAQQGRVCFLIPGTLSDFIYPRVSAELDEPYQGLPDPAAFAALKQERGWCDRRALPVSRHIGKIMDWEDGFPDRLRPVDCCYPALALAIVKLFPVSIGGAVGLVALGTFFLMVGMVLCARRIGMGAGWCAAVALMTLAAAPTLRAIERGQLVLFAAAGVAVFLAWHDSERPVRRVVAALALAVAFALKLTPAVFAVLWLRRGRGWRELVSREAFVFGALALVLLLVPFAWFGGTQGFVAWLDNAAANAKEYAVYAHWGLVRLHRLWLGFRGLYPTTHELWLVFRGAEVAVGCVALGLGWWRRDVVLLAAFMLLVPSNMMAYAGVYLLPVMLVSRPDRWECLLWFVIFCSLQVPLGCSTVNSLLSHLAFWALVAGRLRGLLRMRLSTECNRDRSLPPFGNLL